MFLTGLSDIFVAIDALKELISAFTIDAQALIDVIGSLVETGKAMFEVIKGIF